MFWNFITKIYIIFIEKSKTKFHKSKTTIFHFAFFCFFDDSSWLSYDWLGQDWLKIIYNLFLLPRHQKMLRILIKKRYLENTTSLTINGYYINSYILNYFNFNIRPGVYDQKQEGIKLKMKMISRRRRKMDTVKGKWTLTSQLRKLH